MPDANPDFTALWNAIVAAKIANFSKEITLSLLAQNEDYLTILINNSTFELLATIFKQCYITDALPSGLVYEPYFLKGITNE